MIARVAKKSRSEKSFSQDWRYGLRCRAPRSGTALFRLILDDNLRVVNSGEFSFLFELVTDGAKLPDMIAKNAYRQTASSPTTNTLARRGHLSNRRGGRAEFSRTERPSWSLQNVQALESPGLFAGPLRPGVDDTHRPRDSL
jgi:hypothetical protein